MPEFETALTHVRIALHLIRILVMEVDPIYSKRQHSQSKLSARIPERNRMAYLHCGQSNVFMTAFNEVLNVILLSASSTQFKGILYRGHANTVKEQKHQQNKDDEEARLDLFR